ncbi:MAG: hypothetical protein HY833_00495 [Candidatus Aenigmarchaeota archaeon]|nr:hypothetical protein [Candidatus Aenigmarchaeota archaeon]
MRIRDARTGRSVKILDSGPGMLRENFKKSVISDADGVVESPDSRSMARIYVDQIVEENGYLRDNRDRVYRDFVGMERGAAPEAFSADLQALFRNGGLTRGQHVRSCEKAAEEFGLVSGYSSGVRRMREMAYELYYLSASPRDTFEFAQRRLMVDMGHVKASEFYFDRDGFFQSMEINLGPTRSEKRDEILRESCSSTYGFEIMVDDNPVSGQRLAKQGWNHFYFWVAGKQPLMENVSVSAPDIRDDYGGLADRLKKVERAMAVMLLMDERGYRYAVDLAHDALEYGDRCLVSRGLEFEHHRDKFMDSLRRHMAEMGPIFPASKSGLAVRLAELRIEDGEAESREMVRGILEKFRMVSLESRLSPCLY